MVVKKSTSLLISIAAAALFVGCGGIDNTDENIVGGNFVSAEVIDDINDSVMLGVIQSTIDANATNAFGYKAVKIVYNTTTPDGKVVKASGLLVIPKVSDAYQQYLAQNGKSFSISSICDNHGTIFKNDEAPSIVEKANGLPDYSVAVLMSGYAGFATIAPDYLGYGESNDTVHPYIMKSSAQASLDMIKASIRYMQDNGIAYNGQLFVSGYSEGGYVAMNLAREIEQNHADELTLKGVAPMAGPYDVEALGTYELNATKNMIIPAFLAEIASSYANYYNDIDLYNVLNKAQADAIVQNNLFGGDYNTTQIHEKLGFTTNDGYGAYPASALFQTAFIDDYHNNLNNSVKVHFEENNAYKNWTPSSPLNLIHCQTDEVIPFALSSQIAYDALKITGASVTLTEINASVVPPYDGTTVTTLAHQRCASVAYGSAVKWFDAIRQGEF